MNTAANNADGVDLFNAVQMGYVVVESRKLDDWCRFLKQGLGLHLEDASDELLAFRMDAHARRFIVQRGPAEDVVAIGYQLRDAEALNVLLARLAERGIATESATDEQAAERGVQSFVRLKGPKGITLELFTDALTSDTPLNMLSSGFVTGDGGMGHVAITTRLPEKMRRFWQELFDARLSDQISQRIGGLMLDIRFLRLNERHHSVAIAAVRATPRLDPIRTKVQHISMLANSLDDVAHAFERLRDLGYEMAHEIGQHPNDREVSFYVLSPSGFEIELGCDALTVDEASWKPTHYGAISVWGHKPANTSFASQLALNAGNARRGLKSLLKAEYSPI